MARALGLQSRGCEFESHHRHAESYLLYTEGELSHADQQSHLSTQFHFLTHALNFFHTFSNVKHEFLFSHQSKYKKERNKEIKTKNYYR